VVETQTLAGEQVCTMWGVRTVKQGREGTLERSWGDDQERGGGQRMKGLLLDWNLVQEGISESASNT